jgi:hypothetical protein
MIKAVTREENQGHEHDGKVCGSMLGRATPLDTFVAVAVALK